MQFFACMAQLSANTTKGAGYGVPDLRLGYLTTMGNVEISPFIG